MEESGRFPVVKALLAVAVLVGVIAGALKIIRDRQPSPRAQLAALQRPSDPLLIGVPEPEKVRLAMDLIITDPARLAPLEDLQVDLTKLSPKERGAFLFHKSAFACGTCHPVDDTVKLAPNLAGRWGKLTTFGDGTTATFDESYVRESLMTPPAKVVKGYQPIMPPFKGRISDDEIASLIAYLKSLTS